MLSADDPFSPHLNEIFDLKYDARDVLVNAEREEPSPQCPLTFYDRHIALNLLLKNIYVCSSLPNILSTVCDEAIRAFLDHGHKFLDDDYVGPGSRNLPRLCDSMSVYECYANKIGDSFPQFPSKLFLLPDDPMWHCIFVCQDNVNYHPKVNPFSTEAAFKVNRFEHFPDILKPKDEDSESEYKPMILRLHDWARKYPNIAIWEFYAISKTAKKLLNNMRSTTMFKWDMSRTKGHASTRPSTERPLDGDILSQLLSRKHVEHATRSKTRTNGQAERTGHISSQATTLRDIGHDQVVIPRTILPSIPYNPKYAHFVQHAWCRAVQNDATFMIFNCGDLERIGIRNRKTQTLYLSGPIDPVNSRDPTYGKIHLGLHIAIVQDLMKREEQKVARSEVEENLVGKKRGRGGHVQEDSQIVKPKRQRLHDSGRSNPGYTKRENPQDDVEKHIAARQLALITLDYGPYHSPAPSSFFRLGSSCSPGLFDSSFVPSRRKTKYSSSEYFSLTLREPIGEGATGMVHRATATAKLPDSDSETQMNLLIKLGRHDQRERLRGEFAIYQHMAKANGRVEGIVSVHGLFEDSQTGILALLMDDGGTTLMQREQSRTGLTRVEQIQTSDEEREATMRALRGIHKAGVRHRDIRSQNILINSDLKISIIDFDCADLNPSSEKFQQETQRMENLLNGHHVKLANLPL